jgi:hypothetical protein
MIQQRLLPLATRAQTTRGAILIAGALLLSGLATAQAPPTPAQTDPDAAQTDPDASQTAPVPAQPAPAARPAPAAAQPAPITVIIRILDGKTGEPIRPSNLLIRINHRDELFNEGLKLNDNYTSTAALPPNATLLSVEGSYDSSTEVYVNCDSDTGKDGGILMWYSIADILKTGIVTTNLCYRGKYQHKLNVSPVPGEFVFFVRAHNWHEGITD